MERNRTKLVYLALLLALFTLAPAAEAQISTENNRNTASSETNLEAPSDDNASKWRSTVPDGSKGLMRSNATQQIAYATRPEIQEAASSILRMVSEISRRGEIVVVKVPAYNFLGVLQEMQNRKARFLMPNSKIPAYARAVFRLESEQAGLSQLVYLPN